MSRVKHERRETVGREQYGFIETELLGRFLEKCYGRESSKGATMERRLVVRKDEDLYQARSHPDVW